VTTYRSLIIAASLKRAGVLTAAVMPFGTKHDAWKPLESPLT
jgi:hypothetical protein